jgi:two-component system phosphate regulon response regulator PhoB
MPRELSTRTVDTHIRRLRSRLGPYEDAIETVPGFGYRLRDPDAV